MTSEKINSEKYSILVVDDQPNNLKVISSVLSSDYKLYIANNGEKALQVLEQIVPELILLDVMMPGLSGYEVSEKIKKNKKLENVPIIFLTAKSDIDDIVKGFDLGAVDYITKPFNVKEVQVRIKNHIALHIAKRTILDQKISLEKLNYELQLTQSDLEKRNQDLTVARDKVEEHAYQTNIINQKLLESEHKLRQTNEDLNRTNKEKDKFFSIIAHDLRGPFSGLIGLLEIMHKESHLLTEEDKESIITSLLDSSKSVYSLLENLLEWSRIKRKAISYNPDITPLKAFLGDIYRMLTAQAEVKSISLEENIDAKITVMADQMMLSTIFRNLISNAIKFTESGGKIITHCEQKEDIYIISVADNGIGMRDDTVNKLFKLDEHITSLGTKNEKGTGLGLILTKEFIELHEGRIWLDTEPGKGTTFYFSLPVEPNQLIAAE